MSKEHMIYEWAMRSRGQMVKMPVKINIHEDYLHYLDENTIYNGLKAVWEMFFCIYTDIAENPEKFNLPLYGANQKQIGKEFNEVRVSDKKHLAFLCMVFSNGEINGDGFIVDVEKLKLRIKETKASTVHLFFEKFRDYGFVYDGLKNFKLPKTGTFSIEYPDNPSVLFILKFLAEKGSKFNSSAFLRASYRVFEESMDDQSLINGPAHIADLTEDENIREFVYKFHQAAVDYGCSPSYGIGGSESGPSPQETFIRYFKPKQLAYYFALKYNFGKLTVKLRIRNAKKCIEYVEQCPEDIKQMFRAGKIPCVEYHGRGKCRGGVEYVFEGKEKLQCGCWDWGAAFTAPVNVENIQHYIKLVDLGYKK